MPLRFRNLGYTICADNLLLTIPQILKFQKENTAVICTWRKNRISRYFPKNEFENLRKNLSKRNFRREIKIFEQKIYTNRNTNESKLLQVAFYRDKETKNPIIFACSDPWLLQSNEEQIAQNVSKILGAKEKPPFYQGYNQNMGFTDEFDRDCTKYSVQLPVGRRPDKLPGVKKRPVLFLIFS